MTVTRKTVRDEAIAMLGGTTAINTTLNNAITNAHKEIQRRHNYRQMEASTTIDVASGDATFDLPDDCKCVVNPEISDEEGLGYRRLNGVLKAGVTARSADDTGRPFAFRIWKGVGVLYPQANADFTFSLEYIRWLPAPPTDDAAYADEDLADDYALANEFMDEVKDYLVDMCIAAGKRRMNKYDQADYWEAKAERVRKQLEDDDTETALAGVDMQMQLPG